jgi:hypothetical protein
MAIFDIDPAYIRRRLRYGQLGNGSDLSGMHSMMSLLCFEMHQQCSTHFKCNQVRDAFAVHLLQTYIRCAAYAT